MRKPKYLRIRRILDLTKGFLVILFMTIKLVQLIRG